MDIIDNLWMRLENVPALYVGLTAIGVITLAWSSRSNQLDVPTYGGLFTFSRILSFIKVNREGSGPWVQAYLRHPVSRFPAIPGWKTVLQHQFFDEYIRAPDDVLSLDAFVDEILQTKYTFGENIVTNLIHIDVIRSQLTRSLGTILPDMQEEISLAYKDYLEFQGSEWKEVNGFELVREVTARASSRAFVGVPLCRNREWLKLQKQGAETTMGVGMFISLFPHFLRPLVGNLIYPAGYRRRVGGQLIKPILEERAKMDPEDRPADMMTWFYEGVPDEEKNAEDIAGRLVGVNFASIHNSSWTGLNALLWLLAKPEYIEPLREEIQAIAGHYGWTKDAVAKMVKLDSFMKESMRTQTLGSMSMNRKVLKPWTLSNGVTIPPGSTVSTHLYAVHKDPDNYSNPLEFVGFRFLSVNPGYTGGDESVTASEAIMDGRMEGGEGETKETKEMWYTTSKTFLGFGHGKHGCPGRFFAAFELKAIIATLLLEYDIKWTGDNGLYQMKEFWFAENMVPDLKASISIRKRV